jgi:hypothetical protein
MDKAAVIARLADPATRQAALTELGAWVLNTCLLAGTESATAFSVAGTFVRGIATSYEPPMPPIEQLLRGGAFSGRGRYRRKKKPNAAVPGEPGADGGDAADH